MQPSSNDRSLGELFAELSQETSTLVRQEVQLAKTELSETATQVGKDIGFLAVGGAVAYAGGLVLLAALTALLALVLPVWLSALIIGVVIAGIGAFLVRKGLHELKRIDMKPTRTIETLKEDTQWAKEQTK